MPAAGFDLETVTIRGFDRDAVWKNVALPVVVPAALRAGLRIVDRFRPDVVLGMGGYVMAPAVAAARIRGLPYVLHEKDVRPGLATRMFAGGAAAVCTTLPGTEKRMRARRFVLTGVPLRDCFEPRTPHVPPRRLLVTGGSQGARRLNEAVWEVLGALTERYEEVREDFTRINCVIVVERGSQKKIIIGKGASRLKEIGIRARREIENLVGHRVHLELFVKVEEDWRNRVQLLDEFGV